MAEHPAALQLRLLETVVEVAAEKNSTLVLPFPVELLRFLERSPGRGRHGVHRRQLFRPQPGHHPVWGPPSTVTDRDSWQPWTGTAWGTKTDEPRVISGQQHFGELSFREVDGHAVLSAFNSSQNVWQVEVRVSRNPIWSIYPVQYR